ncbi:MAG TPA: hypothetical protein VLY20_05980 [Nitrospiria bacterium]|nr:hypothetical protein [Nitrospiria bacterium]
MFTKTILAAVSLAACCALFFPLGGCGSDEQVPSGAVVRQDSVRVGRNPGGYAQDQRGALSPSAGGRQNSGPAGPVPDGYARNQDSAIPPSAAVQQILLRHAPYLSDLNSPGDAADHRDEERSQRQEVLNRILNEPDPETRRILIAWLKPVVEADPEAMQILKELQETDNLPGAEAGPSDGETGG